MVSHIALFCVLSWVRVLTLWTPLPSGIGHKGAVGPTSGSALAVSRTYMERSIT